MSKIKVAIQKKISAVEGVQGTLDAAPKIKVAIKNKDVIEKMDMIGHTSPNSLVISFDIGIINMAYCLADLKTAKIIKWGTIDLTSKSKALKCKICKSDAYFADGYCRVHRANSTGIRNFTTLNSSEFELRTNLVKLLDVNPVFLHENIKIVLLEKQPRVATEKVKGLSQTLYDYYVIKHNVDNIIFVNANNKLSIYQGPPITCHLSTPHARNKWFAIEYCKWVLRNDSHSLTVFTSFNKQDDPADAFLQLYWYVYYSRAGITAISSNSKNAKWDLNTKKYKSVKARSPGKVGKAQGRYTVANIKYITIHNKDYDKDTKIIEAIKYHFGSVEEFKKLC